MPCRRSATSKAVDEAARAARILPCSPDAAAHGLAEMKGQVTLVCLNCGCMRAHDDMGKPGVNIVYEDVKRAAEANGTTVEQALQTIAATGAKDRGEHPGEYGTATGQDGEPA